ncbi:small RNA degrading nuclease 3-like [Gastrolobium bilobum]|uniref:small RNA degrading nuclease 3-like n=1 Tax=Gastrolobium bilobum TaxID=150636 RepID=UPI002AB00454|nr:small RNA degrading nuclease 3-like [Gastrolobium bilobum]
MDEKIDTADKKVLVDIVKLSQKRGLKGKQGDWKEFLNSYDKKFGAGLSDPAKRSHEILAAFLKTFSKEDDLKFFANIMRHHSNQDTLEQLKDKSHDSPEQRLVQVTLQHPLYPLDYSSSIDEGWVIINLKKKPKVMKCTAMVAVDCEMVLCEDGTEALVKVCVVDHNLEVKLNELVKPDKAIADYRTEITGVSSQDLEPVSCSLADIQKSMKKLLSNGTILVGHSLHNDLRVLKLDHVRVVDTSYIFQSTDGSIHRRPSLNSLCQAVLGYEVRENGAPHNCLDDACAAMKLALAKIKHGVDTALPLVQEHVSEIEMAKLLLHRIPTTVNSKTLHEVVPGDFTLELKPSRKGQGEKYSALAIFKNPQEANDAYENVQGSQLKDSYGRPQKLVTFQLSTGMMATLFVRKMATDEPHDLIPCKRASESNEVVEVSKKAKTDPKIEEDALTGSTKCDTDTHLNEIEALNQRLKQSDLEIESLREQLRQKDFEISMLHKMVSSLRKRTNKT